MGRGALQRLWGGSFLASSSVCWFLAMLGVPWLVAATLHSLPPSSRGLLPSPALPRLSSVCLRVSVFSFNKDISHWIRASANPIDPRFNLIVSVKTLFPNEVTFLGSGET